jgi:hypothetical protein
MTTIQTTTGAQASTSAVGVARRAAAAAGAADWGRTALMICAPPMRRVAPRSGGVHARR